MKNLETVFVVTLVLVVFAPIWVRALGWWYEFLSDNIDTILSFFRKKALTLDEAIHSRGERARTVLANSVQNLRDEAVRLKSSESLLIEKLSQSEAGWHKRTRIHQELSDKFESLQDEISDIREAREKAENELAHVVSEASREREVFVDRAEDAENELDISRAKLAIATKERDELAESVEGIFTSNATSEARMQAMDKLRRHAAVRRLMEV